MINDKRIYALRKAEVQTMDAIMHLWISRGAEGTPHTHARQKQVKKPILRWWMWKVGISVGSSFLRYTHTHTHTHAHTRMYARLRLSKHIRFVGEHVTIFSFGHERHH